MRFILPRGLLCSLLLTLLFAACSPEGQPGSSGDLVCTAGSTKACSCAGGASGAQSCNAGSWTSCSCGAVTPSEGGVSSVDGGAGLPPTGPGAPAGGALPCEVSSLLSSKCGACHGRNNEYPAPMKLESLADLTAKTPSDASKKVLESVLARVQDADRPMPPPQYGPRLSESEIATLQTWVNGGAKAAAAGESCSPPMSATPDAGSEPMTPGTTIDTTDSPEDCEEYFELRAHKPGVKDEPFEVRHAQGQDANSYHCFYFSADYLAESQGLWFKSLADNKKILHHWLLYASDLNVVHAPGSDGPCTAAEPGAYLVAGWAPGAPDYKPPPDVGLDMPHGDTARLILEVHWFNDTGAPQKDSSGVRFCTAKKNTRPHTAGITFTGGEGICLQPGQQQDVVGMCDPDDTQDIHLLRVWPHMHKLGKRMRVTLLRASGERQILHDGAFNFEDQRAYDLDDVIMRPGDRLETVCSYMNNTSAPVPFGEDTQEEMCFGFITAWPANTLVNGVLDIGNWVGGFLQPARRCLDPLGILNSCNGLADYPPPGG